MVDFGGDVLNLYDNEENEDDTVEILVMMFASNDGSSLVRQVRSSIWLDMFSLMT